MLVTTTPRVAAGQTLACFGLSIEDNAHFELVGGRRQRGLQVGNRLAAGTQVVLQVNLCLVCRAASFAAFFGLVSFKRYVAFDTN